LKTSYKTIDEYAKTFPPEVRRILETMRQTIHEAAPDATEAISYQIPAFRLNGTLVYFAAFKGHIGFYPTSSGIEEFRKELSKYKTSKGAVQFPLDEPLPVDLIKRIVRYRVQENLEGRNE
jgi:uncharacterized protein YdhG (YjbR/CyaY superfamily)